MRLLLLRHGESHSNAEPQAAALPEPQGDRLTERGRRQAEAAGRALRDCGAQRLLTSPMRRARETAEVVGRVLRLEVEIDDGIHELRESADWFHLPPEEQKLRRWSSWMAEHAADADYAPGDAESFNAVRARVRDFMRRMEAVGEAETVLAVTHGIFLRFVLIDTLLGPDFRPGDVGCLWRLRTTNCGLSEFVRGEPRHPADPEIEGWRCATWMQPLAERPNPVPPRSRAEPDLG